MFKRQYFGHIVFILKTHLIPLVSKPLYIFTTVYTQTKQHPSDTQHRFISNRDLSPNTCEQVEQKMDNSNSGCLMHIICRRIRVMPLRLASANDSTSWFSLSFCLKCSSSHAWQKLKAQLVQRDVA